MPDERRSQEVELARVMGLVQDGPMAMASLVVTMESRLEVLTSRLQAHEDAHQRALADLRRSLDNLTEFVEAHEAAILELRQRFDVLNALEVQTGGALAELRERIEDHTKAHVCPKCGGTKWSGGTDADPRPWCDNCGEPQPGWGWKRL